MDVDIEYNDDSDCPSYASHGSLDGGEELFHPFHPDLNDSSEPPIYRMLWSRMTMMKMMMWSYLDIRKTNQL